LHLDITSDLKKAKRGAIAKAISIFENDEKESRKLIKKIGNNKKILVAACDTFRAAAIDQLKEWSESQGADFFQGSINQDPASVAYSACEKTKNEKYDYLIIDTAGRLSNNTNLLNQLIKIKSVINKSTLI